MEKNSDVVGSLKDAYSLFVFGIRTQITRDYYLRRLRTFFDFIKLLPEETMEARCNYFAAVGIKDHDWTFTKIVSFLQFQKERVERQEISAATLRNFVKSIKLFCEMSDVPIPWKKITRGLPKFRRFADDRAPTIDPISPNDICTSFAISLIVLPSLYIFITSSCFSSLFICAKNNSFNLLITTSLILNCYPFVTL